MGTHDYVVWRYLCDMSICFYGGPKCQPFRSSVRTICRLGESFKFENFRRVDVMWTELGHCMFG